MTENWMSMIVLMVMMEVVTSKKQTASLPLSSSAALLPHLSRALA